MHNSEEVRFKELGLKKSNHPTKVHMVGVQVKTSFFLLARVQLGTAAAAFAIGRSLFHRG